MNLQITGLFAPAGQIVKTDARSESARLAVEALTVLQDRKDGRVASAVRKLELLATLLDDEPLLRWCRFHLGQYLHKLPRLPKTIDQAYVEKLMARLGELQVPLTQEEIIPRLGHSGGGFNSVEFIEETLQGLVKRKLGNDGTHYLTDLRNTLTSVANAAYARAAKRYSAHAFGEIPGRQFDVIRHRVDDLLLDVCPDAIEKFMSAYERLGSQAAEDWSLALTATRRVIKSVADALYPPRETSPGERKLGEEQYINRLWAFMDENAPVGSDKDLAKSHIDYLGSFLKRLNEKASKGVHTNVTYEEAVRGVLYTYLTLGDIIDFAAGSVSHRLKTLGKVDLNSASIAELEAVPGISQRLAREIIKLRARGGISSLEDVGTIKGVGPKTLDRLRAKCVVVPPSEQRR